ncbi:MAG: hypothetical protein KIS66_04010 [Fimbriimonadaceae bacterium]|nr:hypothetical protein [Fimbriimonadaceae bacterium]
MTLNSYAAAARLRVFERLRQGLPPEEGEWDERARQEAKVKGEPQMGATRYEPRAMRFEFVYPDPQSNATVLTVTLASPERIVFLPVPRWVVETIWQGEIDGSFQFESDAERMLEEFRALLTPENNSALFGPKAPTGRS